MANESREYLRFIRSMPCCACGAPPPNHAHHHTGKRGKGQRAHDHHAMPLCFGCHLDLHGAMGKFDSWPREKRAEWQDKQVALIRQRFENEEAF